VSHDLTTHTLKINRKTQKDARLSMNVLVDMTETIQLAKQATELETDTLFKFKELTKFKQEQLQKWHETA